jgi:hypothetical protein
MDLRPARSKSAGIAALFQAFNHRRVQIEPPRQRPELISGYASRLSASSTKSSAVSPKFLTAETAVTASAL